MKKILLFLTVFALVLVSGAAYAKGIDRYPSTVASSGKTVVVPDQATEHSGALQKAIFIHYKKGFAKPPWAGGGNDKGPACYGFLSKGAMLKDTQSLVIGSGLDAGAIYNSMTEWDSHTGADLFSGYSLDASANWDSDAPDGRNELSFGNYPQDGVIAVTLTWGYFSGPPKTREIIEFDIMFDTDFSWGDADLNPSLMDLENITTHEMGHGLGLDDIYDNGCGEVTMYGYSGEGETIKRTIEPPDIAGLQELYGI